MNLIVVRHALAEDREDFAKKNKDDSLRPLTVKGKKRLKKVLDEMTQSLSSVDLIVTSPYVRAKQSAQIVQEKIRAKIVEAAELVPHSPPQAFVKWIKSQGADKKTIVAVGHEPQLSLLISYLLAGKNQSFVELKKSGMASLEISSAEDIETQPARLNWLVSPKLLD